MKRCKYSEQRKENKKALGFPCVFYTNQILDSMENAKKCDSYRVNYDFGDYEVGKFFNNWNDFVIYSLENNNFKTADVYCRRRPI